MFTVFLVMTISAEQFKISEVNRYALVINVLRCQIYFVVYNLARRTAPFAQSETEFIIGFPRAFPYFGTIKRFRKFFRHKTAKIKEPKAIYLRFFVFIIFCFNYYIMKIYPTTDNINALLRISLCRCLISSILG